MLFCFHHEVRNLLIGGVGKIAGNAQLNGCFKIDEPTLHELAFCVRLRLKFAGKVELRSLRRVPRKDIRRAG